jgi:hypothetical protein
MKNTYTCFHALILALSVLLLAGVQHGLAWGGSQHYWINLAACVHNEDGIPGFGEYGRQLAKMGHLPDIWKGDDPTEGPRHFIDLELYGYPNVSLDRNQPGLYDREIDAWSPSEGIAPWIIVDLQDDLTDAMASNDWVSAVRIAAAMGHYVGDIHMPLHTTENYDGQLSGNEGVHGRWESEMPKVKKRNRWIHKKEPVYIEDTWSAVTNWITESHEFAPAIMEADTTAAQTAGYDYQSPVYFDVLWNRTRDIFSGQVTLAAHHLASLWYTAWVNAGKPPVPSLPAEISEASIYTQEPSALPGDISTWLFFAVFAVLGLLVVWKSMTKKSPRKP